MTLLAKYQYDYIIVGNGLAGLQLAMAMADDDFFKSKKIALVDKNKKDINDKTWSFWEVGNGKWDHLVHKTWSKSVFYSNANAIKTNLSPYTYKSISSLDFYKFAREKLESHKNFEFLFDSIKEVRETDNLVIVEGESICYSANHVFDSRIPSEFNIDEKCVKLQQHFKGYFIKSETEIFNPDQFTVMDYRLRYDNSTSFFYVLPTSKTEALVEYTFFTPNLVEDEIYDEYIATYIKKHLGTDKFTIVETEQGNIPMTDFNFAAYNTKMITRIGTGGGWVKGSTGYSFKHTEKKVNIIVKNLKAGITPSSKLFKNRFRFYDSIFLKVLYDYNKKGMGVFEKFYGNNSAIDTFQFLDEETNIIQELRIMFSMYSPVFVKSFTKKLIGV